MADQLSEEQVAKYKEAFDLVDEDADGVIYSKTLGTLLRALGYNPTEADLKEMISGMESDNNSTINFTEFLAIVGRGIKDSTGTEEELMEPFRAFDKNGNGKVTVDQLKFVMTSMGEKLGEDEISELVKEAEAVTEDGMVNYEEFVKMIVSQN